MAHFGKPNLFMDIDNIPFGVDFRKHIQDAVGQCDLILAVMGKNWLGACHREGPKQGQRRLDDPTDFVRIELQTGLERNIPVIPVLVGGASMPGEQQLPDDLKSLVYRNAAEASSGRDFHSHMDRLIEGIEHHPILLEARKREESERKRQERLQEEGETKLRQFVRDSLERTQGRPTQDDTSAAKDICKHYRIPAERARQIVADVKAAWQKTRLPRPGQIITNSLGMKFAWIPPGTFLMGSPVGEAEREVSETQHKVQLTKGYYLGVHQVTQGQWQAVMGNNPSAAKGEKYLPGEQVSWDDCQHFLRILNQRDGPDYRLPTEAEWEYACRAGATTPFYFGHTISADQANYDGTYPYANEKKGVYRQRTTHVGTFPANAWGLYDMHGNVWEWCGDWYGEYPKGEVVDPQGPRSGQGRVLRGGSFYNKASLIRSAYRLTHVPTHRSSNIGFRVARTFTP